LAEATPGAGLKLAHAAVPFTVQVQVNVWGASFGRATAVNCWVKPLPTVNELGDTAVVTSITVIDSVPVTDVSPTRVAVTVTAEVGVEGAV
jgi:hypothetical protein